MASARVRGLKSRVPVSTAGNRSPEQASYPGPIGLNKRHEDSLLSFLEAHYGWTLAEDGNLYAPNPITTAWRSNAS